LNISTTFLFLPSLKPKLPTMNSGKTCYVFLFAILFFTYHGIATATETQLLFSISSEFKARLGVVNRENHALDIEITNNNGDVFFSKTVSGGQNYFQLLDLTAMPDGQYNVRLSGFGTTTEKEFSIANHRAELIKQVKLPEPSFHLLNGEVLAVNYPNINGKSVNIFFELNNEVVFEDRNISEKIVNKKYSLKQLPRGEYFVKLYSEGNIFTYPLVIK
jgi:hypothetical protein